MTTKNNKQAILIANNSRLPRVQRRARMIKNAGYDLNVYGFDRGRSKLNAFPADIHYISLGEIQNGGYAKRIPALYRARQIIREKEQKRLPGLVFCQGFDCAWVGVLSKLEPRVMAYEIADLRYDIETPGIKNGLLSCFERQLMRHVNLMVITSHGFANHFITLAPNISEHILILENKMPADYPLMVPRPEDSRPETSKINLGFVGAIRYEKSLYPIIEAVASRKDQFCFHIYGDGPPADHIKDLADRYENIFFHGPFKNPDDLETIYRNIHLNVVVYDTSNFNVRLAIPNTLFESIYFGVPMIVSNNTALWEKVKYWDIGFGVGPEREGFADQLLDKLNPAEIRMKRNNCFAISTEDILIPENKFRSTLNSFM